MISHERRCIFVHIPQCVGTAIEEVLSPEERHLTALQIRDEVGAEAFASYFRFASIRNPFDRAVSQYRFVQSSLHLRDYLGMERAAEFKRFLELIAKREHVQWQAQHAFVCDSDGTLLVNELIRYERGDHEIAPILLRLGATTKASPEREVDRRRPLHEYYDDETRGMVAELYARDLHLFEYTYPSGALESPNDYFHSMRYLRSNNRRLEHLATLGLPIDGRTVLEIGAGVGDLTSFFLDRGCTVTSTEPRPENVDHFRKRYEVDPLWPPEQLRIIRSDLEHLVHHGVTAHEIIFCYGAFQEMGDAEGSLATMSSLCSSLLILESTVDSNQTDAAISSHRVDPADLRAAIDGKRSLPSRTWVMEQLKRHFDYVYVTRTQPAHNAFRLDWSKPSTNRRQHRTIFIASRAPLSNPLLLDHLPDRQERAP